MGGCSLGKGVSVALVLTVSGRFCAWRVRACTLGGGFAEVKDVPRREMCCGGYAVDSEFGRLAAQGAC